MEKCVSCGGGPVIRETREQVFLYRGKELRYDQPGLWCQQCHEGFLWKEDRAATNPILDAFQAKVDQEAE